MQAHCWSIAKGCVWILIENERGKHRLTLLQPGVKAPGTPKRTPFLPANSSLIDTFLISPPTSWSSCTSGRVSPTCGSEWPEETVGSGAARRQPP
jgi:hypothetical protein